MNVNILLFNGFETLDIFGPVEILSRINEYKLRYFSQFGGVITNAQGVKIITEDIDKADKSGILVIPGGMATRTLVNDEKFLSLLKEMALQAKFCLSICTGSALLAKAGVLNKKKATSNKFALKWVKSVNTEVFWQDNARWVVDGKYYTSSGVSAGMDMALGFVNDMFGRDKAVEIANRIEYIWNDDCNKDNFAYRER